MKKSQYSYFFDSKKQYVGYSWLADDYVSFSLKEKENVKRILNDPDAVLTNKDSRIFEKLMKNKVLIPEGVDEFHYIWDQHKKAIQNTDKLRLTILPTLSCNLDCPYCYETRRDSKMEPQVVSNIKSYVKNKIGNLEELSVSWFGGEPLLYPDIIQDIGSFGSELASKAEVKFSSNITTNATLLSEDNIRKLVDAEVKGAQITLDGSKNRHNQTRVPADGGSTYEQIVSNAKRYLDFDSDNELVLRVHIHSGDEDEIQGIKKILGEFENYKSRIKIYFRKLFSSCTEQWDLDLLEEEVNSGSDEGLGKKEKAMQKLYEEALHRDFDIGFPSKALASCYAAYRSNWVVKPDGLLYKCTVALEKDRSLGRLTSNGIKYFWDRYTNWKKRSSRDSIGEEIKECSVFPLSWGNCPYSRFQNPSKNISCEEIKDSVRTKEIFLALKSRYRREVLSED